jgi:predicted RNA-binding protein YlqC (UPF0109 family)
MKVWTNKKNLIKAKDELEVEKDEPKKNIFINLRMEVWPMNKES